MVDAVEGVLGIEWIDGKSVRFLLGGGAEGEEAIEEEDEGGDDAGEETLQPDDDPLREYGISQGRSAFLQTTFSKMLAA